MSVTALMDIQPINADTNVDAVVAASMENIDAEYEALVASSSLTLV